jgi:homoserine kinase type II
MNLDELGAHWSLDEPCVLRPGPQGAHNSTGVIDTPSGSYVVRAYRRDRMPERIHYELGVVTALQRIPLPFRIPAPVRTRTGELLAIIGGSGVTLSPLLRGRLPHNEDLAQTYAAGRALADLVAAMGNVHMEGAAQAIPFPPFGDFEGWFGSTGDPVQILRELPLATDAHEGILSLIHSVQEAAPELYTALPQQILHRDYDPSNILVEGTRVTGVLDFEFCGRDLRVGDLAFSLSG